eukprot:jgi/Chrzof1/2324/Cz11g11010.t1
MAQPMQLTQRSHMTRQSCKQHQTTFTRVFCKAGRTITATSHKPSSYDRANHLVSDVFHSHHDNQLSDMTSLLTFRFFLGAHSVMSHLQPGRRHVTLLAITNSNTATTELIEQVVGVVNLTMQKASTDFAEAVACKLGSPYVMITNMAVAQQHRRQGIAQYLMNACLQQGLHSIGRQTVLMALLVYKDNEAACSLYQSFGFHETNWRDPIWLRDAERGRVGKPPRILMVKHLHDDDDGSMHGSVAVTGSQDQVNW